MTQSRFCDLFLQTFAICVESNEMLWIWTALHQAHCCVCSGWLIAAFLNFEAGAMCKTAKSVLRMLKSVTSAQERSLLSGFIGDKLW